MDIASHNRQFLRQRGRFKHFSAAAATVAIRWGDTIRQICQLGFHGDGSIHVAWPYLAVTQGIVADAEIREGSRTVELQERGKFTSQLVKFTHHVSGRAHFSLTGKVRTEVGRQSFLLDGPIGRLFELTVWRPEEFKALTRLKPGRVYLCFEAGDRAPDACQVRGEWRRRADVVAHTRPARAAVGPASLWQHRTTGVVAPVAFFGPPLGGPVCNHVLCVTSHPALVPDGAKRSGLVLMGGFDPHEQAATEAETQPVELRRFLAAMFPTDAPEEVRRAVGSIDLADAWMQPPQRES